MDKKRVVLFIVLASLIIIKLVTIQAATDPISNIDEGVNKVEDITRTITDEEARSQYLKQEWTKILNKTWIGPPLQIANNALTTINSVWQIILGIPFTFSWLFFLTFFVWFTLINYCYAFGEYLALSFNLNKSLVPVKWTLFVVFVIIFSTIRIPKLLANLIISIISGPWYLQMIIIILIIAGLIFISQFAHKIKAYSRLLNQRRRTIEKARKEARKESKKQGSEIKKMFGKSIESEEEEINEEIKKEARESIRGLGKEVAEE